MANDSTISGNGGVLRIEGPRLGQVREIVGLLDDLEHAYNNLYVFESLVGSIEKDRKPFGYGSSTPKFSLVPKSRVAGFVLPADKLKLHRIEFRSPGFWEFLGSLNPLEVLRKWSADRHERRKDVAYRELHEAERMRLENEKLKTEVVQDRIRLFEQAGVPKEKIREALSRYLVEPLSRLERHQDAGLLGGAEIIHPNDQDRDQPS
jgi:NACalpha-BTF3-like transcription factor